MRWRQLRRSSNVEDQRGSAGGGPDLGRAGGIPMGGKLGGIGFVVMLAIAYFVGGPEALLQMLSGGGGSVTQSDTTTDPPQLGEEAATPQPAADEGAQFVSAMLGSTEDVWSALFQQAGQQYAAPKLRLFNDGVSSACGYNESAVGPFYCPPDQKVYIDLGFFGQLAQMGGPGDFAQAYVIGHEVGHHVQTLLGTAARVQQLQQGANESERNQLQVKVELQADCYAGVWAHHANQTQQVLEPGDVEEGLAAAQAIGDDTLQRNAGRQISPDAFTHGSSAARMQWLRRGLQSGRVADCDTFAAR